MPYPVLSDKDKKAHEIAHFAQERRDHFERYLVENNIRKGKAAHDKWIQAEVELDRALDEYEEMK